MRLTIEKGQLQQSLTIISKGMSSRSTLPILSGIFIETSEGSLIFRTTDLEISIQHSVAALIERDGATVVPGKLFSDIIKSLPEAAVVLDLREDNLTISCMDSVFVVHTLNPMDFPQFPQVDSKVAGTVPSEILSSMIKKVIKAVSKDESRAILTGVLMKMDKTTLQLVATDSYRLAIAKSRLENTVEKETDIIVPGDVLDEIRRLVTYQKEVIISESENQIIFSFGDTTFITRKIEGSYPNYEAIIPSDRTISVVVETAQLLEVVRRVAITAQPHTPVKFVFDGNTQFIDVSSKTQDVANAHEKVAAQIDGDHLEIGFNHQYITDGLSAINTEEVLFEAQTALKPGILKSVGDEYFFYLTMPVRLDN